MDDEKLKSDPEVVEKVIIKTEEFLREKGILSGYTDLSRLEKFKEFYEERPLYSVSPFEKEPYGKVSLKDKYPGMGNVITMAFPYLLREPQKESERDTERKPDRDTEEYKETEAGKEKKKLKGKFSVYTRGRDYHMVVKEITEPLIRLIEKAGYRAKLFTDSNELPERALAMLGGIGRRGRNGLIHTQRYGSYVFLSEILTDMPLRSIEVIPESFDLHPLCTGCMRCVKACPGKVLGEKYLYVNKCLSYRSQEKNIDGFSMSLFRGRLFGCDTCQEVCPINKEAADGMTEFMPFSYMTDPDIEELSNLTESEFTKKYKITSAGWRGKAVLKRNAMIIKMDRGELKDDEIPAEGFLGEDLRKYIEFTALSEKE